MANGHTCKLGSGLVTALVPDFWRLGYELGALCNSLQSRQRGVDGGSHQDTGCALRATGCAIAHRTDDEVGAERIWAEGISLTRLALKGAQLKAAGALECALQVRAATVH